VKKNIITILLLIACIAPLPNLLGQEQVGPLRYNAAAGMTPFTAQQKAAAKKHAAHKTTATLSLPFFEDFTGYAPYPDSNKWADFEVFINNTMCENPISRGVATFDDLNSIGIPYDSFSNSTIRYADSLTSQPIDISADSAADSLYLSFFYQPQGKGFYPLPQDSLNLYFKNKYGDFILVWTVPGSSLQPFQQVMIPVTDSLYFHDAFQFRFVNIAALDWADAIWNVDYIRLDKNRTMSDTAINDVGFTSDPSFLLNDYTSMPYRQFYANPVGEISAQYTDSIRNNYSSSQSITYGYQATAINNGAVLRTPVTNTTSFPPYTTLPTVFPSYYSTITPPGANSKVIFENTFFLNSISPTDPSGNDTVVKDQVFDDYLAYDDGTAEKSYYLNLFPTLPGKTAVEYHLNQPDTLRGMAIYFGRQIPLASYKAFSIVVYSTIAGVNGAISDFVIHQQDFFYPGFPDSVNHFFYYTLDTPQILPAGTFYMGTIQPAASASDSLYFGLDVNRIGGNHAYYNVLGVWTPSLISGAIMMRPLLGQSLDYLSVNNVSRTPEKWEVMPNPAKNSLTLDFDNAANTSYYLTDIQGQTLLRGTATRAQPIDISALAPGMYFINMIFNGLPSTPQKFIKL